MTTPLDEERRQEYQQYINSPAWKRFREYAIKQAGYKCARCGVSKWSGPLEVHHLTYERFKRERLTDVIVLCKACHEHADGERRTEVQEKNAAALEAARFNGWARKAYGDDWRDTVDTEAVHERYSEWKDRQG